MDVKIGASMGRPKCPKCGGTRLLRIQRGGKALIVCPCGFEQALKKYPTNDMKSNQIETR